MPFVKRDTDGRIVAVFHQPLQEGLEEIDALDPDLSDFLYRTLLDAAAQRQWLESDLSLSRVLEDVIDVLIEKGVFMFTDLPEAAQQKLRQRRGLRKEYAYVETLFSAEDEDFSHHDVAGDSEKFL